MRAMATVMWAGIRVTRHARMACLLVVCLLLAACGTATSPPALGTIYTRSARQSDPTRNPVIVIPGILGSRLLETRSRKLVWGSFSGDYADPSTTSGARLIALPMARGRTLESLRDDVFSDGVVDRLEASILGISIEVDAYRHILGTLGAGGYVDAEAQRSETIDYGDEHFRCFQFAYDWRRDIAESARRLHHFIVEKQAEVRRELARRHGIEDAPVRFDIVAHSMGGLVARYYLRYGTASVPEGKPRPTWAGARFVERLIMVGTPNAGSLDALVKLKEGEDFSIITPEYGPAILGTFPSLYQLMPRTRHQPVRLGPLAQGPVVDLYELRTWRQFGWGMLHPDQDEALQEILPLAASREERVAIAEDHIKKCLERARRLHTALDAPALPPPGLSLSLFAGDAMPTPSELRVERANGELEVTARGPGDGTVLRSSALLDERVGGTWTARLKSPIRWSQVFFLFTDHLGMTTDPHFSDNILFQLLEAQRPR